MYGILPEMLSVSTYHSLQLDKKIVLMKIEKMETATMRKMYVREIDQHDNGHERRT